ncbi:MAG: hemerythrin family protein [Campylobacterales bacterium]|nr:hemerythrin family protein [Campylobacterales bacterium]
MLLDKQNIPMVAMEFMNEVHSEDIDIINQLFELVLEYEKDPSDTNKQLLNSKYQLWIDHTIDHFKGEEVLMEEKKFPPYLFHKEEHDKALTTMKEVFKNWNTTSNIQILKQYLIEDLPVWLIQHIKSMDTVTAMFFKTGLSPCAMR